jgi:hypothetical protein
MALPPRPKSNAQKILNALQGSSPATVREMANAALKEFNGVDGLMQSISAMAKDESVSSPVRAKLMLGILELQLKAHAIDPLGDPIDDAASGTTEDLQAVVSEILGGDDGEEILDELGSVGEMG